MRARSTFRRVLALVFTLEMCSLKVIPLSKVSPRIVGVGDCGIGVLLSVTVGWELYSIFQGVKRVSVDLVGETLSLFVLSHCSSECMYCWRCEAAVSVLGCCEKMVMSSAYERMCVLGCVGVGMSRM